MKVAVIYVQYKGYEYESYIPITDMYMGMVEKSLAYRQFSNKCYYWNNMEFLDMIDEYGTLKLAQEHFWAKYGNGANMIDTERKERYDKAVAVRKEKKTYDALREEIEAMGDYLDMRFSDAFIWSLEERDDEETDAKVTRNGVAVVANFKDGVRVTASGKATLT